MNPRLVSLLENAGQSRLLGHLQKLPPGERLALVAQLDAIDPQFWQALKPADDGRAETHARLLRAEPPAAIRLCDSRRAAAEAAYRRGADALAAGKIAAVMVAGGQGTRLGFPHPKGMFPLGPVSGRTLFQIHVDRLRAVAQRFGASIPLLVMTSDATHAETHEFFASHERFGLAQENFGIFCQRQLPAIDAATGELLFEAPGRLSLHPDGHGGMLPALAESGWLRELQARGIEQIFYFQVDNPLTQIADPEFVGLHLLADSELTTQVVAKRAADERVGNVVSMEGRMEVVEYFDLERFPEIAGQTHFDGSLKLWAGNLAIHLFSLDFLQRAAASDASLPLHRSSKTVPHLDAAGRLIRPTTENGVKFERFIFDLLPLARRSLAVEVERTTHFAPVKNAHGADSAATSRQAMSQLAREWLQQAGVEVKPDVAIEISPLFALEPRDLAGKWRGASIESACFLA